MYRQIGCAWRTTIPIEELLSVHGELRSVSTAQVSSDFDGDEGVLPCRHNLQESYGDLVDLRLSEVGKVAEVRVPVGGKGE